MIIHLSGVTFYLLTDFDSYQSQLKCRHVTLLRYIIMNQCQLKGRHVTLLRYIIMNQSQLKGRHVTLLRYIIMSDMSTF
jgi:hypothetical protein